MHGLPATTGAPARPAPPRVSAWLLAATLLLTAAVAAGAAQDGAVRVLQWQGEVQRPSFGSYVGEPDIAPELLTEGFLQAHPDIRWRREGLHAFHHKRYDEAHAMFLRAAHYADKASMAMLAEMYWKGLGVARDRPIGYAWMDLAAERMYPNFTILRERYWSELDQAEQAAAIERGGHVLVLELLTHVLEAAARTRDQFAQLDHVPAFGGAHRLGDLAGVGQREQRVLELLRHVAGVDDAGIHLLREQGRGAGLGMADHQEVRLHGVQRRGGVDQRLSLLH